MDDRAADLPCIAHHREFTAGFQRHSVSLATDGSGQRIGREIEFDLAQFNQAFFDRLRARVQQLDTAGIYAGVYFFSAEWLLRFRFSGDGYPFTGSNNVNGIDDGGGTGP